MRSQPPSRGTSRCDSIESTVELACGSSLNPLRGERRAATATENGAETILVAVSTPFAGNVALRPGIWRGL